MLREESLVPHAWVEEGVHDVDHEVEADDEEGADDHNALYGREVSLLDGVERESADAGDVEHRLGEDRAAQQDAEVEAEDRHDRSDRRTNAVAEDDRAL